jgi:hypothetical protein
MSWIPQTQKRLGRVFKMTLTWKYFGLRRQAKRDAALEICRRLELSAKSAVAAALQSSLCFASAGCQRSPKAIAKGHAHIPWTVDFENTP